MCIVHIFHPGHDAPLHRSRISLQIFPVLWNSSDTRYRPLSNARGVIITTFASPDAILHYTQYGAPPDLTRVVKLEKIPVLILILNRCSVIVQHLQARARTQSHRAEPVDTQILPVLCNRFGWLPPPAMATVAGLVGAAARTVPAAWRAGLGPMVYAGRQRTTRLRSMSS